MNKQLEIQTALETPAGFLAWLSLKGQKSQDTSVGVIRSCAYCPLAEFLRQTLSVDPEVTWDHVATWTKDYDIENVVDIKGHWAGQFTRTLDNTSTDTYVSVRHAKQVLEYVLNH